jgi:hypothetical protein
MTATVASFGLGTSEMALYVSGFGKRSLVSSQTASALQPRLFELAGLVEDVRDPVLKLRRGLANVSREGEGAVAKAYSSMRIRSYSVRFCHLTQFALFVVPQTTTETSRSVQSTTTLMLYVRFLPVRCVGLNR